MCLRVQALDGQTHIANEINDTLATNPWSAIGVTQTILTDNGTVQSVKATIPAGSGISERFARLKVTAP